MVMRFSVRSDMLRAERDLDNFARRQIPFATAQAINSVAREVAKAESEHIAEVFPSLTPFTARSVRVRRANKSNLTAIVYIGDIAAAYLGPYIDNGRHFLSSRALLNPKGAPVNQFGNLPKSALARLKGRKDVFVGAVKAKGGEEVRGVWQRVTTTTPAAGYAVKINRKGRQVVTRAKPTVTTKLKLLIRFGDALPVKQHLDWGDRAGEVISKGYSRAFAIAFARALSTAKAP